MMKDEKMVWFCIQEKLLSSKDVDAWAKKKKSFLSQLTACLKPLTPKQLEKLSKYFQVKREDVWESGEGVVSQARLFSLSSGVHNEDSLTCELENIIIR